MCGNMWKHVVKFVYSIISYIFVDRQAYFIDFVYRIISYVFVDRLAIFESVGLINNKKVTFNLYNYKKKIIGSISSGQNPNTHSCTLLLNS